MLLRSVQIQIEGNIFCIIIFLLYWYLFYINWSKGYLCHHQSKYAVTLIKIHIRPNLV